MLHYTDNFIDVQPTDYFYEAVRYLHCRGAVSGYSDSTFRPYNNATRAQIAKIVVLAEGWQIERQIAFLGRGALREQPFAVVAALLGMDHPWVRRRARQFIVIAQA